MFKKNCPQCGSEQVYANKYNLAKAIDKKRVCRVCRVKNCVENPNTKFGKSGIGNAFYGKKHSDETKKLILSKRNIESYKTKAFKEKMSFVTKGDKNPMSGRCNYDIWLEKYGIEEANKRETLRKEKISKFYDGKTHPRYGKSPPNKAGSGWSGWYKEWFFRSLRELSYMINVIEKNNYEWEKGELTRIEYITESGKKHTYAPDFIINNKIMVEIKPISLQKCNNIQEKTKAGQKHCEENGMEYLIIDIKVIGLEELDELFINNKIKFTDRTLEKFNKYKEKYAKTNTVDGKCGKRKNNLC